MKMECNRDKQHFTTFDADYVQLSFVSWRYVIYLNQSEEICIPPCENTALPLTSVCQHDAISLSTRSAAMQASLHG